MTFGRCGPLDPRANADGPLFASVHVCVRMCEGTYGHIPMHINGGANNVIPVAHARASSSLRHRNILDDRLGNIEAFIGRNSLAERKRSGQEAASMEIAKL